MLRWEEVRFFLEVCRAGTLSGAARRLGVDETTVGRRLGKLEAALGAKLTHRSPDGLLLTDVGEVVLRSAGEMEHAALALERRAMASDERTAGRVRVTAPGLLGTYFILPALQEVLLAHPDLSVDFLTTIARLDVRRDAEIAIRTVRPREGGLVCRRIGRYGLAPYVRRGGKAPPRDPGSVIAFTEGAQPPIRPIAERFPLARVALRSASMETIYEATRRGLGAADLPCFHADADPELVRLRADEPPQQMDLWLVVQQEVHRASRIRVVVRALVERFARAAPLLEGAQPPRAVREARSQR